MDRRAFAYGVLGWIIPGIAAAIPFVGMREAVGGQALFGAGALWLLGLGPLGCAIAGWRSARIAAASATFWGGLAGVLPAVLAVLAVDSLVTVVTIGPAALLLILPLALGYGVGFAIGAFTVRGADHTESTRAAAATLDRRVFGGAGLWAAGVLAAVAVSGLGEPNGSFSYINLSLCLVAAGFLAGSYLIRPSIGALMLVVLGLLLALPLPAGWLRSVLPGLFRTAGDLPTIGALTLLIVALVLAIWRRPPTQNPDGTSVGASRLVNGLVLLCVIGGPVIQAIALVAWNYYASPFFLGLYVGVFGLLVFAGYSAFHDVIGRSRPAAIMAVAYPAMLLTLALLGPRWVAATPSVAEGVVENRLADGRVVRASTASPLGPPAYALDGRADTIWNAGAHPMAWIEIDLGEPSSITEVRLLVAQSPAGETIHEVTGISTTGTVLPLAEFRGVTSDGEWLTQSLTTLMIDIETIRITTVASPSWVAWREIELIANVR